MSFISAAPRRRGTRRRAWRSCCACVVALAFTTLAPGSLGTRRVLLRWRRLGDGVLPYHLQHQSKASNKAAVRNSANSSTWKTQGEERPQQVNNIPDPRRTR